MVSDASVHLTGAPMLHRDDALVYSLPAGSACTAILPALPNGSGTDFLGTRLSNATPGVRGAVVALATQKP